MMKFVNVTIYSFLSGIVGQEETINSEEVKRKTRPLKLKKKIYEFYSAPITKERAKLVLFLTIDHCFQNEIWLFSVRYYHILYVHKTLRHGLIIEVRIFGKCCVAAHHVIAHPYARFLSCSGSSSSWQKYFLLHTPKLRYLLADSSKNSSVSPLFHFFNLI